MFVIFISFAHGSASLIPFLVDYEVIFMRQFGQKRHLRSYL